MASIKRRPDGKWRARYVPAGGKEIARHFDTRGDAQRWLDTVTASLVRGDYADPRLGRQLFGEYAEAWRAAQVHDESTAADVERTLRLHILPTFHARPIAAIRPSEIQAWVKGRSAVLAPSTLEVRYRWLTAIFNAAVNDGVIPRSPCRGVKLPAAAATPVVPLTTEAVLAVAEAIPERYRALTVVAAATGLRQGEVFGLTVPQIDFLRRVLRVEQQMKHLPPRAPFLGRPKTASSLRTVPLPDVALEAAAGHLRRWPATSAMPALSGREELLVFTNKDGGPIARGTFNQTWRKAVKAAGLPAGSGFHELRHYYASLLIASGASVKVVQARLGHKSAMETLDTYGHLWPDSEDQTRRAVDAALGRPADFSRTSDLADDQRSWSDGASEPVYQYSSDWSGGSSDLR